MVLNQQIFKYDPTRKFGNSTIHISERVGENRKYIYSNCIYFIFTYYEDMNDWRLTYFINRFGEIFRVKTIDDINNMIYQIAVNIKYDHLKKDCDVPKHWAQYIDKVKILENE